MPALDNIVEFRTVCRGPNASNQINVRHYRVIGIQGVAPSEQALADLYSAAYAPLIKPLLNVGASYSGLFYRVISPVPTPQLSSQSGAGSGTRVGQVNPNQVCGIITLRAATAPPRTRGRVYLPVASVTDISATGDCTLAYQQAIQTLANTIYLVDFSLGTNPNVITLRPVIFHRRPPQNNYQVSSAIARTYLATQRRRSTVHGADRVLF